MPPGIVRLFVGNIPQDVEKGEINKLISKICPVRDVYIPPKTITGLIRSFAIVEIESDMSALRKCLQILNNTQWKGSKLRIEIAKQYYVDKLAVEKIELSEDNRKIVEESEKEIDIAPIEMDVNASSIEKNEPYSSLLRIKKSPSEVVMVDLNPEEGKPKSVKSWTASKENKDAPAVSRSIRFFFDEQGDGIFLDSKQGEVTALNTENKDNNEMSNENSSSLSGQLKPGGGKQRLGFGFGKANNSSEDRMACVQDPVAIKWSNNAKIIGNHKLDVSIFQDRFKGGAHAAIDDAYEFAETWTSPDEIEADEKQNVPAVPALTPEDVTDIALEKERIRLLAFLQTMSSNGKQIENADTAGTPSDKPAGTIRKSHSSWGSTIMERYDPNAATAINFRADRDQSPETGAMPTDYEQANIEFVSSTKHFADLSKLKDIYHETINNGMEAQKDVLLVEAEKLALATFAGSASSATATAMSFNFFGPSEEQATSINPTLSSPSDCVSNPLLMGKSLLVNENILSLGKNTPGGLVTLPIANYPRLEELSISDLVAGAYKFHRIRSVQEIHATWLETREKMGLAYKKKRREALKRISNAGYSSSVREKMAASTESRAPKRKSAADYSSLKKSLKKLKKDT